MARRLSEAAFLGFPLAPIHFRSTPERQVTRQVAHFLGAIPCISGMLCTCVEFISALWVYSTFIIVSVPSDIDLILVVASSSFEVLHRCYPVEKYFSPSFVAMSDVSTLVTLA